MKGKKKRRKRGTRLSLSAQIKGENRPKIPAPLRGGSYVYNSGRGKATALKKKGDQRAARKNEGLTILRVKKRESKTQPRKKEGKRGELDPFRRGVIYRKKGL